MDVEAADLLRDGCAGALGKVSHDNMGTLFGKRTALARPIPLAAPVMTATFPSSLPGMVILRWYLVLEASPSQAPVETKTFLSSVNASRASGPSSRPIPDRLKPPKGVQ